METWREELHEDLYHAFKGREWKNHKYIRKEGNRYIYPEDLKKGRNKGWLSDAANAVSNAASSVASTVGSYAPTAANTVSSTANTVAQEASNVWSSVSTAVGSTATNVYNNISNTVNSVIESLKNDPSWPKQKGDKPNSDGSSRATMTEKKEGTWNERLNTYIKARLAKIGDNQEQFEELYTAVSWLVAKALYNMDSKKVATPSTPLWHGLDAASLAQAIGIDPSDASSDMYTSLMYCLWSVLDAKRTGSKNPLVEGKKEHNVIQNTWNSVTGKTQQAQNALVSINTNASKRSSATQAYNRSVVIKPKRQSLSQSDIYTEELYHHGIKGQRWGVRRFQNEDGSLTEAGKKRYGKQIEKAYGENSFFTRAHRKVSENGVYAKETKAAVEAEYARRIKEKYPNHQEIEDAPTTISIQTREYLLSELDKGRHINDITNDKVLKKLDKDYNQALKREADYHEDTFKIMQQVSKEFADSYRDALLKDIGIEPSSDARELIRKHAAKMTYNWD